MLQNTKFKENKFKIYKHFIEIQKDLISINVISFIYGAYVTLKKELKYKI